MIRAANRALIFLSASCALSVSVRETLVAGESTTWTTVGEACTAVGETSTTTGPASTISGTISGSMSMRCETRFKPNRLGVLLVGVLLVGVLLVGVLRGVLLGMLLGMLLFEFVSPVPLLSGSFVKTGFGLLLEGSGDACP